MKKILFLAVALVMSVCSMWADIAPGTYTIKAYGTDQYIIPSSNWFDTSTGKVTGADKVAYSTTATLDNGGHWTIANASEGGGFTISPTAAKFVHSNGDHGYLNPWSGTSNVGTWKTTAGDDRWDFQPVSDKENVYTIESKSKSGYYLCYNPSVSYLQYLPTASITGEMVYEWVVEIVPVEYTVSVVGAPSDVTISFKGEAVVGSTFSARGEVTASDITATVIPGYKYTVSVSGTTVTVTYAEALDLTKKYYFKNNYADKYVVLNASGNATISATNKTAFELAESGSGFTIKAGTNYLGASGWNTQSQSSAFVWTVAKVAEGYKFNQQTTSQKGYLGLNANTSAEGSKLYCNKGNSDPIVFTLEAVPMSSYVLTITGQDGAKVTYGGNDYTNGQTINCYGLDASEIEPQAVENYITQVTVGDGTVTVAYYYAKHITDLEQLSNDKAYVLICARGQLTTNGEGLSTTGTPSYAADASKFAIYNDGENLYLWSIALEGFVNTNKGVATTPHQVLALTKQSDNTFLGILNGKGLNMQNNGASIVIDTYTTPDPGNKYNIYEVGDFGGAEDIEACLATVDVTYEFYLGGEKIGEKVFTEIIGQTPSMTTWFAALPASNYVNITSLHNDPITAESGNAPVQVYTAYRPNMPFKTDGTIYKLDLSNGTYYIYANSSATNAKETRTYGGSNDYKWQMGGNWFTGFTFRNLSGYYIAAPSSAPTNGTNTQVPTELSDKCYFDIEANGELGVRFKPHGGTNYLAHTSASGLNVQFFDYYKRDSQFNIANRINFTEVPSYDWDGFSTKLQQLQQYTIGTGLGKYADLDLSEYFINGVEEALGLFADDFAGKVGDNYAEDLEIMDYILANLHLNMPQAGQLFRMRGVVNTGKYLQDTSNSQNKYVMATEQGASSIFYFDGNHLLNYNTGLYTGVDGGTWAWAAAGAEGTQVTFHDASTPGAYRIQIPKGTGNYAYPFLYSGAANASNADRGGFISIEACTDTKYQWILEEVTTLPVTFKTAGEGFATLYSPVALTIPAGVTAYTLTEEENYLKANVVTDDVIPAETGVVLFSETTGTTNFDISDEAGTAEKGVLTGTLATIPSTLEDGNYVFSIANETAGFYKFGGTVLTGFKAYYVPSTPSEVQGFILDFGGITTGISNVNADVNANLSFDLQGRRVNKATRGLFIHNGVKVIK